MHEDSNTILLTLDRETLLESLSWNAVGDFVFQVTQFGFVSLESCGALWVGRALQINLQIALGHEFEVVSLVEN